MRVSLAGILTYWFWITDYLRRHKRTRRALIWAFVLSYLGFTFAPDVTTLAFSFASRLMFAMGFMVIQFGARA